MSKSAELQLEINRLTDEIAECKAAIKDAAYCAEETAWKQWWLHRYSALLPNDEGKRHE